MHRPVGWLGSLAIVATLALLLAGVLVFPRLLHPALSPAQLAGVASAEKRVELQQAQARLQNDARTTLLQGVAGLLLVAGAVATWRQVQVNREGQITERFARAVDQLGSGEPDVRLGGIYTLERIARDSPPTAGRSRPSSARWSGPTRRGWSAIPTGRRIPPRRSTGGCPGSSTGRPTSRRPSQSSATARRPATSCRCTSPGSTCAAPTCRAPGRRTP